MAITLKAARVNAGLSQLSAARLLGVTADTLRNYEKYKSFPEVPTVAKMIELYGLGYEDLIFLPTGHG